MPELKSSLRRFILPAIIGLSILLRLGSAVYQGDRIDGLPGVYDQYSYDALARRVAGGHGFSFASDWWPVTRAGEPTAHWSYLYTLYLAAVYQLLAGHALAARILQAVIAGILHPLLAWRIGTRLAGSTAGLIAALFSATYAYFAFYGGALMTETFYILAVLWVLDTALVIRASSSVAPALWLRLGLSLGCAVLLRQVFLLFVPILFVWLALAAVREGRTVFTTYVRGPLVALAVLSAMILPWTVRNYFSFGRFALLNSSAGFAFYWANHAIHGTSFIPILPSSSYRELIPPALMTLNEVEMEQALMRLAVRNVRSNPGRFLRLSASRLCEYVRFWPADDSGSFKDVIRGLSFGLLLPVAFAGIFVSAKSVWVGHGRYSAPALEILLLFSISYTLIHLLSWTLIRYRLPVDAVLLIFASVAAASGWERLSAWRLR